MTALTSPESPAKVERRGTRRRRRSVIAELLAMTTIYLVLFELLIGPMRRFEVDSLAWVFRLVGARGITSALGDSLLIAPVHHRPLLAYVSPSCSSLMGILALGALALTVLRGRRGRTVTAYLVAATMLFVLNLTRMGLSCLAGLWLGRGALLLFHDWVGTVWNFVATLFGFLVLLFLTLPSSQRAEQDRHGRHTARRPEAWARAGLGYRTVAIERVRPRQRTLVGWIVRHVLPAPLRRTMARRRESNRIDYRIGFLNVKQRCEAVRELSATDLETHGASLLALATYDNSFDVLNTLAPCIAQRCSLTAMSERSASLILWSRIWSLGRDDTGSPISSDVRQLAVRRLAGGALSRRRGRRQARQITDVALTTPDRIRLVQRWSEEGLAYHRFALVTVAAFEEDNLVIQALVDAIAKRQWEPVSVYAVSALRLWARGWLTRRAADATFSPMALEGATSPLPKDTKAKGGVDAKSNQRHRLGDGGVATTLRTVAVTGAGGPAGVAVARALIAAGHRVIALDADPFAAGMNLPGVRSAVLPRAGSDEYGTVLTTVLQTFAVEAVMCTVVEEYESLRQLNEMMKESGCRTWLPDARAVEACVDKARFAVVMDDYEIAHPPTATTARQARSVPGPWVVKPRQGRGSRGVLYVTNSAELRRVMIAGKDLVAQSQLEGDEFTADVLVDRNGQLVTCVPRWRLETRGGISVKGLTFDSEEVTRICAEVVAAVGITGPANIQGMVDRSGSAAIIEMNPRFSGGLPLTLAAGADVVGAYLEAILEPDRRIDPLYFNVGVRMTRYFDEAFEVSSE